MWWIPIAQQGAKNTSQAVDSYGNYQGSKSYNDYLQNVSPEMLQQYAKTIQGGADQASSYQQPYYDAGVNALGQMQNWTPEQMGTFTYNKDVNSFLDPSMEYQNKQQQSALSESQMAKGRSLGGAAAKELQQLATNQAQTDYGNSYNRMTQDKQSTYQQFLNEFNAKNAASNARLQNLGNLSQGGQAAGMNIGNIQTNAANNVAGTTYLQQQNLAEMQAAQNAQRTALPYQIAGNLIGGAGQSAGAFSNAPSAQTQAQPQQQSNQGFFGQLMSMYGGNSNSGNV